MADGIVVKTNLPEFRRQMAELGRKMRPVVGAAVRAGASVFVKAARRHAPKNTGALRRNIIAMRAKRVPRGTIMYIVGVRQRRGGGRKVRNDTFYWRFLEQGWKPRGPGDRLRGTAERKTIQRTSSNIQQRRFPFLDPAWDSANGAALKAFYRKLDEGVAANAR